MVGFNGFAEGHYARHYRRVAEQAATSGRKAGDGYIHVDVPGLEGLLAFPVGGLAAIVGWPGSGKSILCDNVVAKANVPVVYLPLQATCLESAHEKLCAVEAGLDYWEAVVRRRSMADRIALAEASERLIDQGKVLVCLDDVTPSMLNDVLMDIIGESEESPGTIDEGAEERLVVIDNVDMLAADGLPLWQRLQFLKDVVKCKRAAIAVVVAGDYDELCHELANADEVYSIEYAPSLVPMPWPADADQQNRRPERRMRKLLRNVRTSRHDGHSREAEFEIDLPTRAVCDVEGCR
jgi:hypothetical protein